MNLFRNLDRQDWVGVVAGVIALAAFATAFLVEPAAPQPPATKSAQPKITWSEKEIEVILSPGETASQSVSFTSNLDITDIVIEPVHELAEFLAVTPNAIGSVGKNVPQPVTLEFGIPSDAALGEYDGTVHVKNAEQTVPQTLKVVVSVWSTFVDPALGFSIIYPPDWIPQSTEPDVLSFIPMDHPRPEYGGDVTVFLWPNPTGLSIDQYFDGQPGPDLFAETTGGTESTTIDGHPGLWLTNVTGIMTIDILLVATSTDFLEFRISGSESVFDRMKDSIIITD